MHRKKFKNIENEFKQETKAERQKKGRFVLTYAFGSIALFILVLFLGTSLK